MTMSTKRLAILEIVEGFDLNYHLGGAVAAMLHGEVDLAIEHLEREIARVRALPRPRADGGAGVLLRSVESPAEQVDHPAHYNHGPVEVIDVIEQHGLGFCMGNFLKYVLRAPHKGAHLQDLEKAAWYLRRGELPWQCAECGCFEIHSFTCSKHVLRDDAQEVR